MGTCILHDNRSNVSQVEVDYPTHYLTRGYRLPRKGFTVNSFFTMRQLGPNVREMEKHQVAMYLFALILSYSAVGFIPETTSSAKSFKKLVRILIMVLLQQLCVSGFMYQMGGAIGYHDRLKAHKASTSMRRDGGMPIQVEP